MTTSKPRQRKTPRQRAEETLAAAERRVARLTDDWQKARATYDQTARDRDEAIQRLEYARKDPALDQSGTSSTDQEGTTR